MGKKQITPNPMCIHCATMLATQQRRKLQRQLLNQTYATELNNTYTTLTQNTRNKLIQQTLQQLQTHTTIWPQPLHKTHTTTHCQHCTTPDAQQTTHGINKDQT